MSAARLRRLALVALCSTVVAGAAWALLSRGPGPLAARAADAASLVRPAGSLLGPFPRRPCAAAEYAGEKTPLYTDRPYHTAASVAALEGLAFCRGKRHGRELWILEIARPTTLYSIASPAHELERSGWKPVDEPVRVDAAGLVLDRLYRLRVDRGRYAVHYGHATTANPVFWNPRDVRVLPLPAGA